MKKLTVYKPYVLAYMNQQTKKFEEPIPAYIQEMLEAELEVNPDIDSVLGHILNKEKIDILLTDISLMKTLMPRTKKILMLRFEGYTLDEIAKKFDITRERVRQLEKKYLGRIRDHLTKKRKEYFKLH